MDNTTFLLKHSSPFKLLIITYENKLKEVSCPFTVIVIKEVRELVPTQIKRVEKVMIATNLKLVFLIDAEAYYYYYFDILL